MRPRDYYLQNQDKIKATFEGALSLSPRARITTPTSDSIFRSGYVVQWNEVNKERYYEILDVTNGEFYRYVHPTSLIDTFFEQGFYPTADRLMADKLSKRVEYFTRKIEGASRERNDSMIVHWRNTRQELIDRIARLHKWNLEVSK